MANIKQINTRAKSIRKGHPSMSWHDAQRKAAAALRGGGTTKKKRRVSGTAAVGKTRKKRMTHMSGAAAVGKTRKKKKSGFFGATNATTNKLMTYGTMAAGFAGGAIGTHMVLRPLEHKIVGMITDVKIQKIAARAMPASEIVLGGMGVLMFSKSRFMQAVGWGVFGSGVHSAMKELPFHMHSPAETINGVGDYITTKIPMNGTVGQMIAGLIQKQDGYTRTAVVGASVIRNDGGRAVMTPTVGARYSVLNSSPVVGSSDDDGDDEMLFRTNLFARR